MKNHLLFFETMVRRTSMANTLKRLSQYECGKPRTSSLMIDKGGLLVEGSHWSENTSFTLFFQANPLSAKSQ
jgi:hypothetical protein